MHASPRARTVFAPVLLALALVTLVAPSISHHHEGPTFAHGPLEGATFSPGALHPDAPAHVEPTRPIVLRTCEVCLLRAETRGMEILDGVTGSLDSDPPGRIAATDPRLASLGVAGPPGSRGPPPVTVVS